MTEHRTLTFFDIKDRDDLQAIALAIHSFGAVTTKEWVRSAMDPEHWDRITSIAETTPDAVGSAVDGGFSWVSAAVIGQGPTEEAIALLPPAHLAEAVTGR